MVTVKIYIEEVINYVNSHDLNINVLEVTQKFDYLSLAESFCEKICINGVSFIDKYTKRRTYYPANRIIKVEIL